MAKEKLTKEEKKALKEQKKAEKQRIKEEKKRAKAEGREYIPPGKEGKDDESEGGATLVVLAALMIVLVWLGILGFLIKMDVGGVGSTVLYPILKDVPVVKLVLPKVEGAEDEQKEEVDPAYQFASMDEAVDRIKELEAQLKAAQEATGSSDTQNAELQAQVDELSKYKANEENFEKEKEKFYEEVVFSEDSPDINEYKKYYEQIQPENAEKIYRKVIEQLQADAKIQDYANTYSSMKPDAAAGIFDTMTENLDLVAKILGAMSVEDRSKILAAMSAENAARLTEIMQPQ